MLIENIGNSILINGDCIEAMQQLIEKNIKVDAIITDPPYGTTACKWDSVIPFDKMWDCLNKLIKDDGAIVLFGSEPFSSALRMSNISMYRYDWVWNKNYGTDFQLAKLRPMRCHENISVFSKAKTANGAKLNMIYNPQKTPLDKPVKNGGKPTTKLLHSNNMKELDIVYTEKSPMTVINFPPVFNNPKNPRLHPTQKPLDLMEYLIKTYTNENEIVLDFTMGSGTTGVACLKNKRNFIGIELDEKYYNITKERLNETI